MRHFSERFEAKVSNLRRLLRSVTSCTEDISKLGCWWRSVSKRGSTAAAGDRGLERVSLSLESWTGRIGGMNFGGRPKVWLARTSLPRNRARKTWDVYSWVLDIFPTVRGNGIIVLDRNFNRNSFTSFLLDLRRLNVDISNKFIDSVQHSIVS